MTTPRRALPPDDGPQGRRAGEGARRAAATPPTADAAGRRGGATPSSPPEDRSTGARRAAPPSSGHRTAWRVLGALGLALAVIVAVLYAITGGRPATTVPAPTSGSPSAATPSSSAEPTPDTHSDAASLSPSPAATDTASASASAEPSPSLSPGELDLLDTILVTPDGWEVYADEVVQDSRRLVRLKEPDTDVRVQAVSLTGITGALDAACTALVDEQRSGFTSVAASPVVDVATAEGASGASCAFTGTRTSDRVPVKTEFTLLRRDLDDHTLVFRDTIPTVVPADSQALVQLTTMECDAAEAFGAAVDDC